MSLQEKLELRLGYKDSMTVTRDELNSLFYGEPGEIEDLREEIEDLKREMRALRRFDRDCECEELRLKLQKISGIVKN